MYFVRLHYQNAKLNVFTQQYQPIRTGAPIDDSIDFFDDDVDLLIDQLISIVFTQNIRVSSKKDSLLWREIERFYYIKATRLFGAQIRYLVYGDHVLPGTLNFLKSSGGMENSH